MKKIAVSFSISLLLVSCSVNTNTFPKYKRFDEFTLKGIDSISSKSDLKNGDYLSINESNDTIFVDFHFRSCPNDYKTYYIKKDDYYYHFRKKVNERKEGPNFEYSTEYFFEKFIFNDTIITYEYDKFKDDLFNFAIIVDTRDRQLIYDVDTFSKPQRKYNLDSIRKLIKNENKFYDLEKVIKGDTLFVYRKINNASEAFLYEVYLLEGKGLMAFYEFCYPQSIISKFYDKNGKTPIIKVEEIPKSRIQ